MKKFFTLIAIAFTAITAAQAQTVTINKVDGTKEVLSLSDVQSIEYSPAEASLSEQIAGVYEGVDTMSFDMMAGVQPYTVPGNVDSVVIRSTGDNTVSLQFTSVMTHTTLGTRYACVKGLLTHITLTDNGDNITLSNKQADGTQPDSVQASMSGPVTDATKSYAATLTGTINKATHEGTFHIDTRFGNMGPVHFVFTPKTFKAE